MNPPLRFDNEACRHKILDLIGDLSLVARGGNGGFPVAHIVAFKASATFRLSSSFLDIYRENCFLIKWVHVSLRCRRVMHCTLS